MAPTRPHCNVRPRSGGGTQASNRPSLGAGGACSACRAMQWPPRHSATPEDGVGRDGAGQGRGGAHDSHLCGKVSHPSPACRSPSPRAASAAPRQGGRVERRRVGEARGSIGKARPTMACSCGRGRGPCGAGVSEAPEQPECMLRGLRHHGRAGPARLSLRIRPD